MKSTRSEFNVRLEKIIFSLLLIAVAAVLFYICFTAEATYDGGDGLSHYLISRYSWKHPGLFLDHWGKPFFTLVSSPFSQFGLIGMNVFQILCAAASSYFCYKIAEKLQLKYALLLPIFIFFSPIYFAVINSGLTEIFFGCVLMLSVWMIFEKKYIVASVAASFLLFIRVDAYVIIPLIAFTFCIRKQFGALFFLFIGFIIYSVLGYYYYGDILWVMHKGQNFFDEGYPGLKGEFFHYPKHYAEILGTALSMLLIIGLGWRAVSLIFFFRKSQNSFLMEEIVLIYGSFFACLVIHTLSYCLPGVLNNLGMMRYLVTLVPAASLICLRGLNVLIKPLKKFYFQYLIACIFLIFVIISPFKQDYFPYRLEGEPRVVKKIGNWMKINNPTYPKICFFNPALHLFYDVDPFDEKKVVRNFNINVPLPSPFFPAGSLLIWDTHYGGYEGKISPEKLDSIPALQLLQKFEPDETFTVIGGREFEIRIYKVK